jgi:carboxymethylenebutenolidase
MNLFQRYLVEEFTEDYQEGHITRRQALKLIGGVVGSLAVASTILAACAPQEDSLPTAAPTQAPILAAATATTAPTPPPTEIPPTQASAAPTEQPTATSSADSAEPQAADVEFPGQDATLLGYQARPAGDGPFPLILVCHENRGLTPHIKDVTRRLAQAGYAALAVDLLSRQGGVGAFSSDQVPGALGNTSPDQFVQDFLSGWRHMESQPFIQAGRVGMVGFCFGGGVTWLMATCMPELKAAVPFYGPHPPVEDVPDIQAAVLGIYASNDQRINQGIPAIEEAMLANNKIYEKVIYPNTDHAFHNDTGSRYNAEAAQDAWRRTLEWFGRYV